MGNIAVLKPQKLEEYLEFALPRHIPTVILGGPGIGKTQIPQQVAKRLEMDTLPPLYLAMLDPVDIGGMNLPTQPDETGKRRLERLLDDWLEPAFTATSPTMLLIDEFSQGSHAIQCAAAPLLDARRCGKHVLPDCVSVLATGNQRQHKSGAVDTLTHVISRTVRIKLEVDPVAWIERAVKDHVAPEVISFIKASPSSLDVSLRSGGADYEKIYLQGESYENPRSWYLVSTHVKGRLPISLEGEIYTGIVGEGVSRRFVSHLSLTRQEVDLVAIMGGAKWAFPPKEQIGTRYAFTIGVGSCANRETIETVFDIAKTLYEQGEKEYAMVVVQTALGAYEGATSEESWLMGMRKHPLGQAIIRARRV